MTEAIITPETAPRMIGGRRITPVKARSPHLNLLLYAESGTGKTVLSGSADLIPAMRPVLVIDIEGGTESLKDFYPEVDVVRVKSWADFNAVYNDLRNSDHGYETVVLDSLTEIQKFCMDEIMRRLIERKPDRDPDVPDVREWGQNLSQMRRVIRLFRDLPMHTIFTALVRTETDNAGKKLYLPSLNGKLASEAAAFMDIVGYYYTKDVQVENEKGDKETVTRRVLLTARTSTHTAKDRTNRLPRLILDPTMETIFNHINTAKEN